MTDKIVVMSTCANQDEAERIARALLEQRVAACVNIVPGIGSHYWWQGAIESASEWLLIIKSTREQFAALRATLEKEHSYEVPEVIALPILEGSPKYLQWIEESLRK